MTTADLAAFVADCIARDARGQFRSPHVCTDPAIPCELDLYIERIMAQGRRDRENKRRTEQ